MKQKIRSIIYSFLNILNPLIPQRGPSIIVLSYHSVSDEPWNYGVSFTMLKKQISLLSNAYQFLSLDDLFLFLKGEKPITKPSVIITFDDGYKNILQTKSFFEKLHIKPALFVLAKPSNANRKELDTKLALLGKDEILSLYNAGWTIGSHTSTHADLSKCNQEELEKEVLGAKKILERQFHMPIHYFAYPRGEYKPTVLNYVEKAGYRMGLTVNDGIITKNSNRFLIPRITITNTHTIEEFSSMISPAGILFREFLRKSQLGKLVG